MEPQTATNERSGKKGSLKWIILVIVLALLVGGYYFLTDGTWRFSMENSNEVLATVNGAPITKKDVSNRIAHATTGLEAQGIDFNDAATMKLLSDQALQELVNEHLVLDDAKLKGIAVTDAEVDARFAEIKGRFADDATFVAELTKNSFTEATLRDNVKRELTIEKYVLGIQGSLPLSVSQAEIVAFYNEIKGQNENVPPLTELSTEIETQLKNQKLSAAVGQAIEALRSKATVILTNPPAETSTTTAQ